MAVRLINRDFGTQDAMMRYKGRCIMIYSYYDTPSALKFFRRQLPVCYSNECPLDNFYFYLGGYHLFLQLEKNGQKTVRLDLPFRDDPVFREDKCYSAAVMKQFFYEKARYHADKFDERNHNSHFSYLLEKKYEFMDKAINKEDP